MFTSPAAGPGGVRWLQPVQRRRRRRVPVGPILAVLVLAGAAVAGVLLWRSRDDADDPSQAVAQRFADAWARGDLDEAWRLTTPRTRAEQPLALFKDSYAQAARAATVRSVRVGDAAEPRDGRVAVPVVVRTRAFGEQRGTIVFPCSAAARRPGWRGRPTCGCPGSGPASASSGGSCARRSGRTCSTRTGAG